jgi:hypothetical protein
VVDHAAKPVIRVFGADRDRVLRATATAFYELGINPHGTSTDGPG